MDRSMHILLDAQDAGDKDHRHAPAVGCCPWVYPGRIEWGLSKNTLNRRQTPAGLVQDDSELRNRLGSLEQRHVHPPGNAWYRCMPPRGWHLAFGRPDSGPLPCMRTS